MSTTITIPQDEYNLLKNKAELFDHYVETEELKDDELARIKLALKGNFYSKEDFLKKHKYLA